MKRIELLFKYNAYPYVMLHEDYRKNPNSEVIRQIARICNTPMMITNKTIKQALIQSEYRYALDYLNENDKWFLNLKFNSKLYKKIQNG